MQRYDPLKAPKAEEWNALDEDERLDLVRAYHRKLRPPVPNLEMHANYHVLIENQAALADETPVRRTLARFIREGVDGTRPSTPPPPCWPSTQDASRSASRSARPQRFLFRRAGKAHDRELAARLWVTRAFCSWTRPPAVGITRRHCEERSDEAIQSQCEPVGSWSILRLKLEAVRSPKDGLLRFARNDGALLQQQIALMRRDGEIEQTLCAATKPSSPYVIVGRRIGLAKRELDRFAFSQ
jgi:hypothetical protein